MESISVIENKILMIRGKRVMMDADLAFLYGVPTKRLNEQVKRNIKRFPADFMFQLNNKEFNILNQSQIATGSQKHRDPKNLPYVFTEHGVTMLASVLNSDKAIETNILIVRAFIKMRELISTNKDLAQKINDLEKTQDKHSMYLVDIYNILRDLREEKSKPKKKIGFNTDDK